MSPKQSYETKCLDHLGIVAGVCNEIGLIEQINQAIEITYGYSKEHRPDLKQVVVTLITGHRSQLPVWMEALSGNSSDKDSFPKTVQAFCEQMKSGKGVFFVVDSAMYSAANLHTLGETRWLTRVPKTLADAKQVLTKTALSQMTELDDGYAYFEYASGYGQVAQRWLVVYSPKAAQREEKTLARRVEKEKTAAKKAWRKLAGQIFNCQEDAQDALAAFQKRWKYHGWMSAKAPTAS